MATFHWLKYGMKASVLYVVPVAEAVSEHSSASLWSRVWAEPCLIEAAKEEYSGVIEEFLATGEKLFGPYVWGRCGIN